MGKSNKTAIITHDASPGPDNHSCHGACSLAHSSAAPVQDESPALPVLVPGPAGGELPPVARASATLAQKFPLHGTGRNEGVGHFGSTKEMGTHDDAAANRPPVPDLRHTVPLTGGRVHQL